MFSGLVEEVGIVRGIINGADSARILISAKIILQDIKVGDSIAVNGVCLTIVKYGSDFIEADIMAQTLAKTNLNLVKNGDKVNLERALRLIDRLGGHLVAGHVDCLGRVTRLEKNDIAILVTIKAPADLMRYIIKRGSIAINGVSLTVTDYNTDFFTISMIPHTSYMTNLGYVKIGDQVNLEGDIVAKHIERLLDFKGLNKTTEQQINSGLTKEKLAAMGYF
ncbi:MAG: riboflavin synthase [Peptococcaceae bacterium]|nr:riboflavin synthase [Peptococcaceae bacterium]